MFDKWPSPQRVRGSATSAHPAPVDPIRKPVHKKSFSLLLPEVPLHSWFRPGPAGDLAPSSSSANVKDTSRKMSIPNIHDHIKTRGSLSKAVKKVLSRSSTKSSSKKTSAPGALHMPSEIAIPVRDHSVSQPFSGLDLGTLFSAPDAGQRSSYDRNYAEHVLRDTSPGGAEARAAAARANLDKARSASASGRSNEPDFSKVLTLDAGRESGISLLPQYLEYAADNISVYSQPLTSPQNKDKRADPLSFLPNELALNILSFLDAKSLDSSSLVSRAWSRAVSDQQVWKQAFMDRFVGPWPPCSHPIPIGGQGIGGPDRSGKDWRQMYRARERIEENWRQATTEQNFSNQTRCHTVHLFGHTDSVYCVQFDERKIITGSRDKTIRVWDMQTYKCLKIVGCPDAIESDKIAARMEPRVSLMRGLPQTFNSTESNYVPDPTVWHVPRDYHTASILCLQYDDQVAITGSSDSTLIIWDLRDWQPVQRLRRHRHGVLDLAFDSEKIVSCSKDYNICVWDRQTGDLLSVLMGHQGPVNAVQLRGNLLVSASGEGTATLWNLNFQRGYDLSHGTAPAAVNATVVRSFSSRDRGLACVEFSDDGKHVLAGGNDQVIFKYEASTGRCVESISGHRNLVRSLFLDGVNGRVVSGSYDMSIRVWDWSSGQQICHFPDWAASWILSAKSDYRRIVSTSQDGRVLILDFGHNVRGAELLNGFSQSNS